MPMRAMTHLRWKLFFFFFFFFGFFVRILVAIGRLEADASPCAENLTASLIRQF